MAKTAVEALSARDDSEVEKEHQVLYRKFRPRQFGDVVGQDHIIKTLQRKIVDRKVGHAFLFVGPRGCGKTTTARLLAMASNCENLSADGEPCGECATCASIVSGAGAIGLHELDAASNRGIGEMKALIDTMGQGSVARKKVYIIDEAHMLTKEASNALLKTLEEPPADTLIILATTEANKVLPTIQSRATRYNFKTVDVETMTALIKEVVDATGIEIDAEGIAEVVRRGHGSPRDTLTALEGYGGEDSGDDVRTFIPAIAEALAERDSSKLILSIAEAVTAGVDVPDLTRSLLEHWRNCLLALEAPAALDIDRKEIQSLEKQAKAIKANRLVRLLNVTAEALGNMASSGDARLLLETTLLQISQPSASDSLDAIHDRLDEALDMIEDLTKLVKKNGAGVNSATDWPPIGKTEPKAVKAEVARPEPVAVENEPEVAEKESEADSLEDDTIDISVPAQESDDEIDDELNVDNSSDDATNGDEGSDVDVDEDDDTSSDSDDDDNDSDDSGYDDWDTDDESDVDPEKQVTPDSDDNDSDEDNEQVHDISELIGGDDDVDRKRASDDDDIEHNHDEDEPSGFLDCPHPDCVEKLAQVKKAEKEAPRNGAKVKEEKKESSKDFYDEDKAPTARDLVEIIQYELIDRKYMRYLQDDVMGAKIEEEDDKVYLVLRHKKESNRVPTTAAIDAITSCVDNLWVDEIEYIGKER